MLRTHLSFFFILSIALYSQAFADADGKTPGRVHQPDRAATFFQIDDTATVVIMMSNPTYWYETPEAQKVGPSPSKSVGSAIGGAAGGAIVGSLICPGIGTFIGAIAGSGTAASGATLTSTSRVPVQGYWVVIQSKRGKHLRSFNVKEKYYIGQELQFGQIHPH